MNNNIANSKSSATATNINNIGIKVYTFNKQGQLQAQGQIQGQAQGQVGVNGQQQQQAMKCPEGFVPCLGQDGCVYYVPEVNAASESVPMEKTGFDFMPIVSMITGAGGMLAIAKSGLIPL